VNRKRIFNRNFRNKSLLLNSVILRSLVMVTCAQKQKRKHKF
jgi:hypothetical protein